MPADKFQTKNGGKNHGRWFYTCQSPQHKRCGFFLWADDAKVREEGAILSNSRSEPGAPMQPPQTPKKEQRTTLLQPVTPQSRPKLMSVEETAVPDRRSPDRKSPTKPPTGNQEQKEDYEWSSSDDDDLASALDTFETPRKTPRTGSITSPGKRNFSAVDGSDDVFTTPSTTRQAGLLSPSATPVYPKLPPTQHEDSSLTSSALRILGPANISSAVEKDLTDLFSKYELRAQGISKGRDIARLALQSKDKKIVELQSRIGALETERETMRNVISLLKSDMATSPKKGPRRPRAQQDEPG